MTERPAAAGEVTALLRRWRSGDAEAEAELAPLLYGELKRIARRHLRGERPAHTLQPTALVHEAYLRLSDRRGQFVDRVHFFAAAARAMRGVLVDHARARRAEKRGGGAVRLTLDDRDLAAPPPPDLLDLDNALTKLARFDARKARIVELRYFAGLSTEEIAAALEIGVATVGRDARRASAWLAAELNGKRTDVRD